MLQVDSRLTLSASDFARFMAYVDACDRNENGCWQWPGYLKNGYGALSIKNHAEYAHRISLAMRLGPIPDDIQAMHDCDNRPCINPFHLLPGTQQVNIADAVLKGRNSIPPVIRGEAHPKASLSDLEVEYLLDLAEGYGFKRQRELSRQFGISQSSLWRFIKGKTRCQA